MLAITATTGNVQTRAAALLLLASCGAVMKRPEWTEHVDTARDLLRRWGGEITFDLLAGSLSILTWTPGGIPDEITLSPAAERIFRSTPTLVDIYNHVAERSR